MTEFMVEAAYAPKEQSMSEKSRQDRLPYERPEVHTEFLRFVTPLGGTGGTGGIVSGPFRDPPPDEEPTGQG